MSFLDKISDSKARILVGLGGVALLGALGYLYNNYVSESQNENHQVQQQKEPEYNVDLEIQKLKDQINLNNPSLEDVKKILIFSLEASKREIFKFSKNFKKDRKKFNRDRRNQNLDQYLRLVAQGMAQIQEIGMTLQQTIMSKIGVTQQHFARYQSQLGPFLQEQMMLQGVGNNSTKELTLEQVKKAINLQIDYMRQNGEQLAQKFLYTCSGWSNQQKQSVPTLLSVYISDEVFEDHPEIDEEDLQGAQMRFQHQLQNQMIKLQQVMGPIMGRLTQGLGFGGMGGGYGGMGGGMDMGGMDMGGYNGPSMEQLEQLRLQDPAAFEQLMQMMSQGMR